MLTRTIWYYGKSPDCGFETEFHAIAMSRKYSHRHLSITSTLKTFFHFGCLQLSLSDGNVSWFMAQLKMECLLLVKVEMCRQAGKN